MEIMVDSGAYSAWRQEKEIPIEIYIEFLQENKHLIEIYANLDCITDPIQTWVNQRKIEKAGLSPMPVYHTGEPLKFLEAAMEYDLFAVGGVALKSAAVRENLFEAIFSKVCPESNNYYPIKKVHAFGVSSVDMMLRYPWYSIDSTSWVSYGRYGWILVPKRNYKGKWDYGKNMWRVNISSRSPSLSKDAVHFERCTELEKTEILSYIEQQGFELGNSIVDENKLVIKGENGKEQVIKEGLCNNGLTRDQFNLLYFIGIEELIPEWPWPLTHNRKIQERLFTI